MRRAILITLGVIATILVLAVAAIAIVTNTDWGRERVRRFALGTLSGTVHGRVKLGRLDGNLLHGATVSDVSITDSSGAPFVSVDSASVQYSIGSFLSKKIMLHDVRLVRPVIVLDKRPGMEWNYKRIFPSDTTHKPSTGPGFGSWVDLRNVTLVGGRTMVRTAWAPADSLSARAKDSTIAAALSDAARARTERVAGGFQRIMDFRDINASLPRMRIADPDSAVRVIQVAHLSAIAEPFRPPAATVRDLAGTFFVGADSLWFKGVRSELAASRISGDGWYTLTAGDIGLALHADTLALADLRWLYPSLPSEGGGRLDFAMRTAAKTSDFAATNATIATGGATLAGRFGLAIGDTLAFHDTDLRFTGFDTRLIEQLVPTLKVPRRGTLAGRASLGGSLAALRLNADVAFADTRSGTSRVTAVGVVGVKNGFSARDLHVRMEPVQVDLARIAMPTLPIGGTVSGTATVNGSTKTTIVADADLTHSDRGAVSRVTGRGSVALTGDKRADIELRARPLSLTTIGRFAPAAGLTGEVRGPIRAHGVLSNLVVSADLRLPDGGALAADGTLDVASKEIGYALETQMKVFNLRSVVTKAPSTSLTAVASANGRGFTPATMRAVLAADVQRSSYDSIQLDSVHLRATIAEGMATIDSTTVRTNFARATLNGTFGLAPDRVGTLAYSVEVDSLRGVQRWLPPADTVVVPPRPGRNARLVARARADSIRAAEATEVLRAATGAPAPTIAKVDSIKAVRADSLSGSIYAGGIVRGGITSFDVRGRAAVDSIVARGSTVRAGRFEYAWTGARTPGSAIVVGASLDSVQAFGLALDSIALRAAYQQSGGTVELAVMQDTGLRYAASVGFELHTDSSVLHLRDVALQFDTTVWRATHPSEVRWGSRGIEIRAVELRSAEGGRLYANGIVPAEGEANVDLIVEGLQISNLVALGQSDLAATGIIALATHLGGTRASPLVHGALGITAASYRGTPVPDLRTRFDYANELLVANAEVVRAGAPMATIAGKVPVNLALSGVTGPRLPDLPMSVDVQADSLPLDVLPSFTDAIADLHGRVIGTIAARGTVRHPQATGALALDLGTLRIVSSGTYMHDIVGEIHLVGDTIRIDSIVAHAGGTMRASGSLAITTLAQPAFNLTLSAQRAVVLDNKQGRLTASGVLTVKGPFNATMIEGDAKIWNGVIYIPESTGKKTISAGDPVIFSVVDTAAAGERELLPASSPLLANLQVAVGVAINTGTWVRSTDGNIEIYTPEDEPLNVRVDNRTAAIVIDGVIATERGEYAVAGRRFQINRGTITFIGDPQLNPLLQLAGEHEVQIAGREALIIQVLIGGTLKHPRVALESNAQPPISQSDLISYLAFGSSSSSLLQQGGGSSVAGQSNASGGLAGSVAAIAQQRLGAVALGALAHQVAGEAARSLGADYFNISPADVPAELSTQGFGAFLRGTELEVGKYLTSDLFFGFKGRPAPDAVPGVRTELRIGNGFRLEGSFEPRYILREPTLGVTASTPAPTGVLGLFLIREVRY